MNSIKHTETSFLHYQNKVSKFHYIKFFENNWNNIKNTCKGIKTIISIENITAAGPHSIEFNNKTITDPTAMSNVFNNYFTSVAKKKGTIALSYAPPIVIDASS